MDEIDTAYIYRIYFKTIIEGYMFLFQRGP